MAQEAATGSQGNGAQPPHGKVPRAVRERQMLDVALPLFAAQGFHATTMDAVAEASGVSKPMVYAYFGSKEGLYLACMGRSRERLFAAIDEAVSGDRAPDIQLWHGLLAFLGYVEAEREGWLILIGEGTFQGGAFNVESERMRRDISRLVTQLIGEAATAEGLGAEHLPAIEPIARALAGAAEATARWWLEHPEHPREQVARTLMNLAWMGLGDLVRGQAWTPLAELRPDGPGPS